LLASLAAIDLTASGVGADAVEGSLGRAGCGALDGAAQQAHEGSQSPNPKAAVRALGGV